MKAFPMFLTMQNRRVVIVGGDEQACQKCRLMLKTEAKITVLAKSLNAELRDLFQTGKINWRDSPATRKDFADTALVFIATGCSATDVAMHKLAKSAGALVNVVDQPDLCDAITPSIVDRSPVVVAIGTEGTAPVLARQIKSRMEEILEPRLGDLAALAGRLRAQAAQQLAARDRRDLWRWVFGGPVRQAHARGAEREAARMIKQAIETAEFGAKDKTSVVLIDAGAGAPDLVTLRAVQRLQDADMIYFDQHVDPEILDLARRDAERVMVAEMSSNQWVSQNTVAGLLVNAAQQGKRVVRLSCDNQADNADTASLVQALKAAEIPYEIVPGVNETATANRGHVPQTAIQIAKAS
ncbi:MAG: uroporphyrinogen-III C-methyltransferase [Rhodobacteraceae bacterium]|nr:uroporphyrinogen-III C-methyltransferase [Paracoccaceae bacterium]